jgi:hypothetical protein
MLIFNALHQALSVKNDKNSVFWNNVRYIRRYIKLVSYEKAISFFTSDIIDRTFIWLYYQKWG